MLLKFYSGRHLPFWSKAFAAIYIGQRGGPGLLIHAPMSYYHSIDSEFFNLNRYSRHGRQYAQSLSSSANVEQGEHLPASIDFLDDFFLTPQALIPSSSAAQASLPIQTSLSGMPVLRQSYLDIAFNSSRTLSVEAPVPVSHAARTSVNCGKVDLSL